MRQAKTMNHNALAEIMDSPISFVTIIQNGVFSNAAISLLCRIEHFNEQLDHPQTSDKRLTAVRIGCEILMEILDFSASIGIVETSRSKDALAGFVDRKNEVEALLKRQSWSEMLGRDLEAIRRKQREYTELGERFEQIFRQRFSLLDQHVTDVIHAQDWHESWSMVINEFTASW
jgi:hypothetical protein